MVVSFLCKGAQEATWKDGLKLDRVLGYLKVTQTGNEIKAYI
jgi:hypothetical protein